MDKSECRRSIIIQYFTSYLKTILQIFNKVQFYKITRTKDKCVNKLPAARNVLDPDSELLDIATKLEI